jgi:hypothetical protein
MFISDKFTGDEDVNKMKKIERPNFIPMIGSQVYMGYKPLPIVKNIFIYYHEDDDTTIFVKCD